MARIVKLVLGAGAAIATLAGSGVSANESNDQRVASQAAGGPGYYQGPGRLPPPPPPAPPPRRR
jgi:hypothetical protein